MDNVVDLKKFKNKKVYEKILKKRTEEDAFEEKYNPLLEEALRKFGSNTGNALKKKKKDKNEL